jgi:hypothetical protein
MSWIENANSEYIIITGDSKQYRPLWRLANKSVEYNVTEFEFSEVAGTLVDRRLPKGRKIPLDIYFQGDDCIEVGNAFEESAKDSRAWTLIHPYFGTLIVQPISLNFDFSTYNVCSISGDLIETITDDNPKSNINQIDTILEQKELTDEAFNQSLSTEITDINSPEKNTLKFNLQKNYTEGLKIVSLEESETYFNSFKTAQSAVDTLTIEPLQSLRSISSFINAPINFSNNVQSRVDMYKSQFDILNATLSTITTPLKKRIFENQLSGLVSSICVASITNRSNSYQSRLQVIQVINFILTMYNGLIISLDTLQTLRGDNKDSYIPDANSLINLSQLVNFTISNLFIIALSSKQERSILLENDSNAILLTHRFYGLDNEDLNLIYFMETNNIGINELLNIGKGRRLVYYI